MPARARTIWASRSTDNKNALSFWACEPKPRPCWNESAGILSVAFGHGLDMLFEARHLDELIPFLQIPPGTVSKFEVQENEDGSVLFRRL